MKCRYFNLILFCVFGMSLQAQNSENVVKDVLRFSNPEWFQSPAQPGKKNYKPQPFDSVLIEYTNKVDRKKILIQTLQYTGDFKNGLFNGKGKLLIKQYSYPFSNERPGIFSCEGDFENGVAAEKAFLNYSWSYTPREMKPIVVKMNCQVDFKDGRLTGGLIRYDHVLNDIPVLTAYYSGGLYMKNWVPVLHGLGIVYVSKNSPGSEMAKRSPGIEGGFYAGNFFYGEYTGFAVCNYLNGFDNDLSNLLVGIVGKGELLHTFSTLPVKKDWTYRELLPTQNKSENFAKLFGDFSEVKNGVIYLDKENRYTGGIKNDSPHGIGYIENGNGFYDISFWKEGKRLSVQEVLGRLLPDSSMVQLKKIKRKVAFEIMIPNGTKTGESIRDADYFGRLNHDGNPEGWGVLLCKQEEGYAEVPYTQEGTVIGNFKGVNLLEKCHENNFLNLIKDNDNKQAFVVGLRYNDLYQNYVFIPAYATSYNKKIQEYYSNTTPVVAAVETESFKEDMNAYQASKTAEMAYISGRKPIEVNKVYLSSKSGNSYVETSSGETIYLQELTADKINYGDYILYNEVFYEVNRSFMLNDYVAPNSINPHLSVSDVLKKQKGYVLKGYWMAAKYEPDPDKVCVYCEGKAPGKSTYTGVGYTGRYETNVYNNNSGGVNIVSKPITTITTVTVDNKPCKFCKGNEVRRRAKVNIIRNH